MRRLYLAALALIALCGPAPLAAQSGAARMLVQSSPLAGFRYYEGKQLWNEMRVGDRLDLVRERDNRHDANAIRVEWNGHKLGYVPRKENAAVARHMDDGGRVEAHIVKLQQHRSPWKRIEFEVFINL